MPLIAAIVSNHQESASKQQLRVLHMFPQLEINFLKECCQIELEFEVGQLLTF